MSVPLRCFGGGISGGCFHSRRRFSEDAGVSDWAVSIGQTVCTGRGATAREALAGCGTRWRAAVTGGACGTAAAAGIGGRVQPARRWWRSYAGANVRIGWGHLALTGVAVGIGARRAARTFGRRRGDASTNIRVGCARLALADGASRGARRAARAIGWRRGHAGTGRVGCGWLAYADGAGHGARCAARALRRRDDAATDAQRVRVAASDVARGVSARRTARALRWRRRHTGAEVRVGCAGLAHAGVARRVGAGCTAWTLGWRRRRHTGADVGAGCAGLA